MGRLSAGSLPSEWGNSVAFPFLTLLFLQDTPFSGTLPVAWAASAAFPALQQLQLGATIAGLSRLSGTLPSEWGSPQAFQQLETLRISNCNIQGTVYIITIRACSNSCMSWLGWLLTEWDACPHAMVNYVNLYSQFRLTYTCAGH